MLNLYAILLPPLAVLSVGKRQQFWVNAMLTTCCWLPGVVHALWIVSDRCGDERASYVVAARRHRAWR